MKVIVRDCMMLSAEIVCTTLLIIIDLIVKHFIQQYIPLGDIHHLIPGILDITYVQNTGAAFSIFSNSYIFVNNQVVHSMLHYGFLAFFIQKN